jgi:hypothetical protein
MAKSWWFSLYTFPILKKALLFFLIGLFVDISLTKAEYYFSFMAYVIPLFAVNLKMRPGSFRSNLEFHKAHIEFKKLKRFFILDLLITNIFWIALFILSIYVSFNLGGFFSTPRANYLFSQIIGIKFVYLFVIFVILSWMGILSGDRKYIFFGLKHRTPFKKFLFLVSFWVLGISCLILSIYFNFEIDLANYLFIASVCLGSIFFHFRAFFHKGPEKSSILHCLFFSLIGLVISSLFYFSTFVLSNLNINDLRLTHNERIDYFKFYYPLISKINRDDFLVLEKYLPKEERYLVYKKVSFNPSQLGLAYFMDDSKNQNRLISLLRYGKPNHEFLHSLLMDFDQRVNFWNKVGASDEILYLCFHRWPQNKVIPVKVEALKLRADTFKKEFEANRFKRKPATLRR